MIHRTLSDIILSNANDKKVVLILGPRQCGKSTFLEDLKGKLKQPVAWWNGDEADIRTHFEKATSNKLRALAGKNKTIIIDEAQRIGNIGLGLKLMYENVKNVKLIATGSSAFELANKLNEPLTGRKWEFQMFPLSFAEMVNHTSLLEEKRMLHHRLIYGYYPEIVTSQGNEANLLKQLANSYLYKDILTWERIQKPDKLEKLVQALSFQVGQLISYYELGQICGLNSETVEKYINLLEKAFIVYRLAGMNRNPRTELKKTFKIFFYDNGLRNAVINQFSPVELRNDVGQLWENWFVSERLKFIHAKQMLVSRYFWRTLAQQEVDYIEEGNGKLTAFECKWNPKKAVKFTMAFTNMYPKAKTHVVHSENFENYLM
jgi:predicted AAA+ superfamily ATPase